MSRKTVRKIVGVIAVVGLLATVVAPLGALIIAGPAGL